MQRIERLVVDESVNASQVAACQQYLKRRGLTAGERFFIAQEHPGIPDSQLLHHLLSAWTILLTTDRPLHNIVLKAGLR